MGMRPGRRVEREGKKQWFPLKTTILALKSGNADVPDVFPGGSFGVLTELDPSYVRADSLAGNVLGKEGHLPEVRYELTIQPHLLERVVGAKEDLVVEPIKKLEPLMLNVNSAATVGTVDDVRKEGVHIVLKLPVCADLKTRITIARRFGARWRLIGWGELLK